LGGIEKDKHQPLQVNPQSNNYYLFKIYTFYLKFICYLFLIAFSLYGQVNVIYFMFS
jgi:hypothetical protein